MGKIKAHEIDQKEKFRIMSDFFEMISGLKSKKETVELLFGLLTASELLMAARRIQIARMLLADKSYLEIKDNLKVGNETIFRTDRWLNIRGEDYKKWIRKCIEKVDIQRKSNKKNINREWSMVSKYSEHRLWEEIFSR